MDDETIRKRVKHMIESGKLQNWRMVFNPHVIEHEAAALELTVDEEKNKPKAISQIKLIDGVIFIVNL